jgi:hypothetical protein
MTNAVKPVGWVEQRATQLIYALQRQVGFHFVAPNLRVI